MMNLSSSFCAHILFHQILFQRLELDQRNDGLSNVIESSDENQKEKLVKKLSRQEMKTKVSSLMVCLFATFLCLLNTI